MVRLSDHGMTRGCSSVMPYLGGQAGRLGNLLELAVVAVLRVQGDPLLDCLQRCASGAHLHLGRLHRQRLGLHQVVRN